jgi:glycosyltransferase involved in cell wall biosynthesis
VHSYDVNTEDASVVKGVDITVGIPTRNRSQLLEKAIASVLGQSYRQFTLVVSDNASNDDTADVVASFRDPRIVYRPLERGISRPANTNRLIELAETEFVLLLGDDDELHADHLSLTVDTLKRWPTVGVAHTGYQMIDLSGNTLVPHARPTNTKKAITFESGAQFLERSMRVGPALTCLSSAVFRRAALISGGGLREEDGVIDDFPLLMRIATKWDVAYLNRPLATMRVHAEASSSSLGSFTPGGFRSSRSLPDLFYEHRGNILREAELPEAEARRLARLAKRTYGRDVLAHLSMRANTGDGPGVLLKALWRELRCNRRLWLDPVTWRFVAGQLGGRRLRDRVRRALGPARRGR